MFFGFIGEIYTIDFACEGNVLKIHLGGERGAEVFLGGETGGEVIFFVVVVTGEDFLAVFKASLKIGIHEDFFLKSEFEVFEEVGLGL